MAQSRDPRCPHQWRIPVGSLLLYHHGSFGTLLQHAWCAIISLCHQVCHSIFADISNPRLIVIVGSFGLASNIVGLFLFHGTVSSACHQRLNPIHQSMAIPMNTRAVLHHLDPLAYTSSKATTVTLSLPGTAPPPTRRCMDTLSLHALRSCKLPKTLRPLLSLKTTSLGRAKKLLFSGH